MIHSEISQKKEFSLPFFLFIDSKKIFFQFFKETRAQALALRVELTTLKVINKFLKCFVKEGLNSSFFLQKNFKNTILLFDIYDSFFKIFFCR